MKPNEDLSFLLWFISQEGAVSASMSASAHNLFHSLTVKLSERGKTPAFYQTAFIWEKPAAEFIL